MAIIPYQQTLSHSCLAACFLMLRDEKFTEDEEQALALQGSKRIHQFYVAGIPLEFVKKFSTKLTVYVDNKYFTSVLKSSFHKEERINVIYQKITLPFILNQLKRHSVICHIDDNSLGDYSHASHFIILERATKNFVFLIDPWDGKRKRISFSKLEEAINDLKKQIKMCPLIFSLGE